MIKTIIFSLLAGIICGYCYGLLFVKIPRGAHLFTHIGMTLARYAFLLAAGIYLLSLPSIQPIILLLSFLATFWIMIIKRK